MATVAAVIASTHHPFCYRASTSAGPDRPPFADEWVAKIGAFRQTLSRARPDVLVMVGSDHFHQLWLGNMPQFLIRKAPFYDAKLLQRGRRIRAAPDVPEGARGPVGVSPPGGHRRRIRPGPAAPAARGAGQDHPPAGRGLASGAAGGDHRHRAPVPGARLPAAVRAARPGPGGNATQGSWTSCS